MNEKTIWITISDPKKSDYDAFANWIGSIITILYTHTVYDIHCFPSLSPRKSAELLNKIGIPCIYDRSNILSVARTWELLNAREDDR